MANWNDNNNMCANCYKQQVNLDKYFCPQCGTAGCSSCMPSGEAGPCPYCVEAAEREANRFKVGGGLI